MRQNKYKINVRLLFMQVVSSSDLILRNWVNFDTFALEIRSTVNDSAQTGPSY